MKWPWEKKHDVNQFETVLQRLIAAAYGHGTAVNPETCMASPTVQAIVTAVSRRFAATPIHVYGTSIVNGIEAKQKLPDHPVAKLLKKPNEWQSPVDYWQDLASTLVRHGKYIAVKGQTSGGKVMNLWPINPGGVVIKSDFSGLNGKITFHSGQDVYDFNQVHYVRGPAKDFIDAESPVNNIKTAIGLEIACEEFGASFFNNGALPLMQFFFTPEFKGFRKPEDEKQFVEDFQAQFTGSKRNRAYLLPKGVDSKLTPYENEKSQFLETRKFYQTVIAGAWGVPQHLVGNLENGHYNNVEQQDKDFTINVIMPYFRMCEAAMERDLLTQDDRDKGIVIRFNMDATLRASFEERQKGLQVQFQNGVINQDEWREIEGKNPKPDGDGSDYYYSANLIKEGMEPVSRANTETPTE